MQDEIFYFEIFENFIICENFTKYFKKYFRPKKFTKFYMYAGGDITSS